MSAWVAHIPATVQPIPPALCDELTGLPHRTLFEAALRASLFSRPHDQLPLGVMHIDVDHMKTACLWYGYPVGDDLLRLISHALVDTRPDGASVYRAGGDEFTLLIPRTPLATLGEAIQRRISDDTARFLAERPANGTSDVTGTPPTRLTVTIGTTVVNSGVLNTANKAGRDQRARSEIEFCRAVIALTHDAVIDGKRRGGSQYCEQSFEPSTG